MDPTSVGLNSSLSLGPGVVLLTGFLTVDKP